MRPLSGEPLDPGCRSDRLCVVKPAERLVVLDVATGSAVAHFLNGYVGANNRTGGEIVFFDYDAVVKLGSAGWSARMRDLLGGCPERTAIAAFRHEQLELCTSVIADIQAAIEMRLAVMSLPNRGLGMSWSLLISSA